LEAIATLPLGHLTVAYIGVRASTCLGELAERVRKLPPPRGLACFAICVTWSGLGAAWIFWDGARGRVWVDEWWMTLELHTGSISSPWSYRPPWAGHDAMQSAVSPPSVRSLRYQYCEELHVCMIG
jgi:hypothetical protein